MEVVVLNESILAGTASTTVSSQYPDFEFGVWHWQYEKRHSNISDGGNGHDYECRFSYRWSPANEPRPENDTTHWKDIGYPVQVVSTWTTNAQISDNYGWLTGVAASIGEPCYDYSSHHDYIYLRDLTAEENIIPPSSAIKSLDADQAAYFQDSGLANAFRWYNGLDDARTEKQGTLEFTALCQGLADRICFAGLRNVKTVEVTVSAGQMVPNWSFQTPGYLVWTPNLSTCALGMSNENLTIDNNSSSEHAIAILTLDCAAGTTYEVSVNFSTWATLYVWLRNETDGSNYLTYTTGTGSEQTITLQATPTQSRFRIELMVPAASSYGATIHSVSCKQYGYASYTISGSLAGSGLKQDLWPSIAKYVHYECSFPEYQIRLVPENENLVVGVGFASGGKSIYIGETQEPVDISVIDFSNTKRDDTYGTIKFQKRGSANELDGVRVILADSSGAYSDWRDVNGLLTSLLGEAHFWDFAPAGVSWEPFLIHGYIKDFRITANAVEQNNLLTISIGGIVK